MPAFRSNVGLVVNPLIKGLVASSRMEARSAPSAKILTRYRAMSGISWRFHEVARASGAQNPLRGVAERTDAYEGAIRTLLGIAVVDENRAATCAMAGFDVAPAVANNETRLQIDVPDPRRFEQEPGLRLAAGAARGVVVRTDTHVIQAQKTLQTPVHF